MRQEEARKGLRMRAGQAGLTVRGAGVAADDAALISQAASC
jgi:hypothetical protein